jgi:dipeptidyl aminopeptidase/acylaminoacyl peptidase
VFINRVILVTTLLAVGTSPLLSQDRYLDPPDAIAKILDQPLTPIASLSPDGQWLLLMTRPTLPPIAEVAAPDERLAGVRVNPRTNGSAFAGGLTGLVLRQVNGNVARPVRTSATEGIGGPSWSPNAGHLAFTVTGESGITLWVADVATGDARALSGANLNGVMGSPCDWLPDSSGLLCRTVVSGRPAAAPARRTIPVGPITEESAGRAAPNRTYQDLLSSPEDELLFDHYFTSQVTYFGLDGTRRDIGKPAIHTRADPSPDGRYVLVQRIHRPYSYHVPLYRFPSVIEVWDLNGRLVHSLADLPLQEEVPTSFDAVPVGPRSVSWRADGGATLVWAEAKDEGDPRNAMDIRDEIYTLAAPFSGTPGVLAELEFRYGGTDWAADGTALVAERWRKTRQERIWMVHPDGDSRLLFDLVSEDRYGDPGSPLMTSTGMGTRVIQTTADGRYLFLSGDGASEEGDRPFLDRYEIATGNIERLWRSSAPYYERVIALLDPARQRFVTLRESVDEPPNYFIRQVGQNRLTQLTQFTDPAPEFAGVTKELITYTRNDGVQLSATLYLPEGYTKAQGPLPFLLWAYPREFRTADAAAQVVGSPYRFTRPSGSTHLFLLLAGYGVLDNPTMPILGEGDAEPNDTYIEQLVASAQAAVDKVVELGVADRNRVGIGGHSYGAFMTANLLAHSDIFQAGLARSGAYNRSLTPFGFQAEERTYWEKRDIYTRMSPFTYADRINEPILLIHGQDDNNSGTFPIQSERMYAAIKGNGGKVRLVWLPGEAHGYRARESVGHTLREMVDWMDRFVKNAGSHAATP